MGFIGTLLKVSFFCGAPNLVRWTGDPAKSFHLTDRARSRHVLLAEKNLEFRRLLAGCAIQLFQPWYHLTQVAVFATEKRPLRVPQTAVLRVSLGADGQSIAIKASGRATAPLRQ
jgi:hypothetical protein